MGLMSREAESSRLWSFCYRKDVAKATALGAAKCAIPLKIEGDCTLCLDLKYGRYGIKRCFCLAVVFGC